MTWESESRLDEFLELAELTPEDELVHYGLALEYLKIRRFEEAVMSFKKVIELKPDYSAAYRELGKALDKLGKFEEAQTYFREGRALAAAHGDGQAVKEMDVFLKRIEKKRGTERGG